MHCNPQNPTSLWHGFRLKNTKDFNHGDGRTSTQDVLSQQHLQFTSQTSTALHAEAPLKAACSSLAPAECCHALSPADQRAMI